jgi:murein DD-endopeptidase MepM/ murein hydrolase activator NlpD
VARFPLNVSARQPYEGPGAEQRAFGAPRRGRLHAGCDLYAHVGTPILAVADGVVIQPQYAFYSGTDALEVYHPGVGVVRYGEILPRARFKKNLAAMASERKRCGLGDDDPTPPKLTTDSVVKEGDVIAVVGKLVGLGVSPMLHFELYDEAARGQGLSGGGKYDRNKLLKDPTSLLSRLERAL